MLILEKLGFSKGEIDSILQAVEIFIGLKSITVFNKSTKSENVICVSGLSKSILQSDLTKEQENFIRDQILLLVVQSKKDYSAKDTDVNTIKEGGVLLSAETLFSEGSDVPKTKKSTIQQKEKLSKLRDAMELYSWVQGTNTKYLYVGNIGVLKIAINPKINGELSIRIEWGEKDTPKAYGIITNNAIQQLGFIVHSDYASVHLKMGKVPFAIALGTLIFTVGSIDSVKSNGFDSSIIIGKVGYWQ